MAKADQWITDFCRRPEKLFRADGIRQCCMTCKYLRWSKEEKWTLDPVEVERVLTGELSWDDVWYEADGTPRCVGEETGEYRGVPICDKGVIDFDEEYDLAWTNPMSQKDGRLGRWLAEEYARITDPAMREEFIRRSPNAEIIEGGEFPELGEPDEGHEPGEWDGRPILVPHMTLFGSSGGRSNLPRYQVFIDQQRFVRQVLWESGCGLGKHRHTGRPFSAWMDEADVREIAEQERIAEAARKRRKAMRYRRSVNRVHAVVRAISVPQQMQKTEAKRTVTKLPRQEIASKVRDRVRRQVR